MSAEQDLGPNQKAWLSQRKLLKVTYSFLTIGDPPSEELLVKLAKCTASIHNTTCFEEGTCANRSQKGCAYKQVI